ncbi:MAG: SusC/RagA family TonB-linked outer membrane protein [Odoribacter sp.]|nr:SusC/RagA family TonB-linked outer membrane protein [Odoribacter sp.]
MKKTRKATRIPIHAGVRQAIRQGLTLVLMIATCSWGYARAQEKKVGVNVTEAELRDVLRQVKTQTGVKFVYSDVEIRKGKPVTVHFQDYPLQTALEEILSGQPFAFEIENDIVVIKPAPLPQPAAPQETKRLVSGVVKDDTGTPLPGVSVVVKGTQSGVATDINGHFEIKVSDRPETTLVFSFIGMKTKEVKIGNSQTLDVILQSDNEVMDEVVVTGVQTIEKGRATGSFSLLSQDDMKQIYSTSLTEKLEGAVPGLYVDKDNEITIRGIGSLNANTKPLVVVDGFPMESSELNLNPNDIEQVTVLKDAASASIWGIRAANGVIVITTKRGKKGSGTQVTYNGNVTYGARTDLSDLHLLNSTEYARLNFESILVNGVSSSPYGTNELEKIYKRMRAGELSQEQAWTEVDKIGAFSNQKQIEDNFYRNLFTQQHNISIQTGGENMSTYISLNYDQNKSTTVGNQYNKYNLLVNNDIHLRHNLSASVNLRATHQYSKRNGYDELGAHYAENLEPWQRILNDDGSYYWEQGNIDEEYGARLEALGMKTWNTNSLQEMRMNDKKSKMYNLSSSLRLAWKPIEGLELSTQGNYEFGNTEDIDWYTEDHWYTRRMTNENAEVELDENDMPKRIVKYNLPNSGGIKDISNSHSISYSVRNMITYGGEKEGFTYKVMVGNEFYSLEGNTYGDRLWGYDPELLTSKTINLTELNSGVIGYDGYLTFGLSYSPTIYESLERYTSYFGTASVNYKDRYDLFGSVRLDQTNLLTNANEFRNNPSWSVGAKWNIANEDFFKCDKVDDLGIRLSYGLTGNIDKSTAPDIVARAGIDSYGSMLNYLQVTNPANPELGWERTYSWNLGVNGVFFNNRLRIDADFYNKKSKELLANVEIDPTSGWSSMKKNSAEVLNRGIDLTLYGQILKTPIVKWDATLQFSYNKNKVTSINYTPTISGVYTGSPYIGQAIGYIAVHRYGGLDENGQPTFLLEGDDTPHSYSTLGTLTIDDLKFVGRTTPPVFGSISTGITVHDFTLNIMATYKFGHKMRLPQPRLRMFGLWREWYGEEHRWVEGADNRDKWVPVHYTGSFDNINRVNCLRQSDKLVDDADIIYLKSISLEWNASRLLKKIKLKGGSVRISGENLAYWAANRYDLNPDQVTLSSYDGTGLTFNNFKPRMVVGLTLNF